MCPLVAMSTSVPVRGRAVVHEVRPGPHPHAPHVHLGLVAEEDAGEQREGVGGLLPGVLRHVPVDVRPAGPMRVRRDVSAIWMWFRIRPSECGAVSSSAIERAPESSSAASAAGS